MKVSGGFSNKMTHPKVEKSRPTAARIGRVGVNSAGFLGRHLGMGHFFFTSRGPQVLLHVSIFQGSILGTDFLPTAIWL